MMDLLLQKTPSTIPSITKKSSDLIRHHQTSGADAWRWPQSLSLLDTEQHVLRSMPRWVAAAAFKKGREALHEGGDADLTRACRSCQEDQELNFFSNVFFIDPEILEGRSSKMTAHLLGIL